MEYPKITKEEKDQLIIKRIEYLNKHKKHALDLFEAYYKDNPKDNWNDWVKADYALKEKVIKNIISKEDNMFIQESARKHGLNLKKAANYLKQLKHEQLVAYGVRVPIIKDLEEEK